MLGEELRPGLWRWTAHHEEWKKEVAAYAVVTEDELVLVDPLLSGENWDRLERGLGDGERGEGLHTCPAGWLPQSTGLDDLRAALRPVLDLPVALVLPSHGSPVLSRAREALAEVATPSAPVPSPTEWVRPGNHRTSP